jgi:hypothetical protein
MKTTASLLLFLFLAFTVFGQTEKEKSNKKEKPDFSGTWILDKSKSKKPSYDLTLTVAHREPELKITSVFESRGEKKTQEQVYYTDGRRLSDFKEYSGNVSQEMYWLGSNIILKSSSAFRLGGRGNRETETIEEWEISKDGNFLTVTIKDNNYPISLITQPSRTADGSIAGDTVQHSGSVIVLKFKRLAEGL